MRRLALLVVVLLGSCGTDDDGTTPAPAPMCQPCPQCQVCQQCPPPGPTAEQIRAAAQDRCATFSAVVCGRLTDCTAGAEPRDKRMMLCRQSLAQNIDCGRVTAIGDSYDRCVRDLVEFECPVLVVSDFQLKTPASCEGALLPK